MSVKYYQKKALGLFVMRSQWVLGYLTQSKGYLKKVEAYLRKCGYYGDTTIFQCWYITMVLTLEFNLKV